MQTVAGLFFFSFFFFCPFLYKVFLLSVEVVGAGVPSGGGCMFPGQGQYS